MEDEKYTKNTGRPPEKSEPKTGHSEKLKSEKASSSAAKNKFGKKKGDGSQKLKKSGEGKRRIGLKAPIPTPPPPGTKNFHGHDFQETNDVAEDIRDNAGFTGFVVGTGLYTWDAKRPKVHGIDYSEHPEWAHHSSMVNGRYVAPEDMAKIRGGNIGKAIESDGSSAPKHKTYYTRYCAPEHEGTIRGVKNLSEEQIEQLKEARGYSSKTTTQTQAEAPKHKSYYTKYCGSEHEMTHKTKGYSGKLHRGGEDLSIEELEYYEGSNPWSRANQKRSTQKKIMERASQAKTADSFGNFFESIGEKIEALVKKLSEAVMMFVKDNPVFLVILTIASVGVLSATGTVSAFGVLLSGINNSVVSTSFTAEDDEIKKVEEDFEALEADLSSKMDSVEDDYPGYDKYRYTIAPINHDPIELAALLTVLYEDYTEEEVKDYLKTIIDGQYNFTVTEEIETRTKTETKWHWVTKTREEERTGFRFENGHLVEYTYTVTVEYQVLESYEEEVEYDYYILNVNLTGMSIDSYVQNLGLSEDQLARYNLLKLTKGNKEYLFEDS